MSSGFEIEMKLKDGEDFRAASRLATLLGAEKSRQNSLKDGCFFKYADNDEPGLYGYFTAVLSLWALVFPDTKMEGDGFAYPGDAHVYYSVIYDPEKRELDVFTECDEKTAPVGHLYHETREGEENGYTIYKAAYKEPFVPSSELIAALRSVAAGAGEDGAFLESRLNALYGA